MERLERGLAAEVNVTPLIDVLLVLLVIFMLIPRKRWLFPVNVPPEQPSSGQAMPQIVLQLEADHSYALNSTAVPKADLPRRLTEVYAGRPAKLLFIRVLGTWRYREVIEAADIARGAGVQVIGYVPSGGER